VETNTMSMHDYPNSKIKFNHFSSTKYASSHQLAAFLQAQIFHSKADVLLKTEVLGLEIDPVTGISRLITSGSLNLEAPVVLVATGLGVATTKIRDTQYAELYAQKAKEFETTAELNSVMSTETFMKLIERARLGDKKVVMPKSMALIGNGDGARIVVEELLDSRVKLPENFKIFWLGNEANTADEYIKSQLGWDRYIDRVVPFYKAGVIDALPGHVSSVIDIDGTLKIKLDQKDNQGNLLQQVEIEAAMIVDSTGYDNVGKKLVDKSFPGSTLADVTGSIPFRQIDSAVLARQVVINGQPTGTYLVGPAAGSDIVSKAELGSFSPRASVSIHLNIPKVYQLVKNLFEITREDGLVNGAKKETPPVMSSDEILKAL
ncbi:MAG: hypothetical protein ACK5V3_18245, partial [Bdellovibrionales bacterium]